MARDEEIRDGLDTLVLDTLDYANRCPNGTDEKKRAIEDVTKVYNVRKEQAKADCEYDETYQRRVEEFERRKADNEFREKQLEQQHKEFLQKIAADGVTTVAKLAVFGLVGKWAGNLETLGSISSKLGNSFFREGMSLLGLRK